jgi:heat shock protein HslJ
MIRNPSRGRWLTLGAVLVLATALIAPVAAQDENSSPEGVTWRLTGYQVDETVAPVPLGIDATLLLQDGQASGSGGCNTFNGTYGLDGTSLTFGDEISTTLMLCEEEVQAVEDAYLAALPEVAGWAISAGVLTLTDDLGTVLLTFEVPAISLTSSQLALLVTTLAGLRTDADTLRTDLDALRAELLGLNVPRLRDRIRELEQGATELQDQVDALEGGRTNSGGSTFSRGERILLEGIPERIADRCQPLRSGLPKGTLAAVRCTPATSTVATIDYHLMAGDDAAAAFADDMDTFNVPEVTSERGTCEFGVKSQQVLIGGGWQSEGCYRTSGRAEVRFVDNATDCRQLQVGDKRLRSPAYYIALQGTSGDVSAVHAWATRDVDAGRLTSIANAIPRPSERLSPSCPT